MPTPETPKSATLAVKDFVGDTCVTIMQNHGYGESRVWKDLPPSPTDYPFISYTARETPTVLMPSKDGEDVRAVATVKVKGLDDVEVDEIAAEVQETLTDKNQTPSIAGFRAVWHNLLFHNPMNETREDEPDIFGRVLEFEYELEPNS